MYTVQTNTQNRNVKLAQGGQRSIGLFGCPGITSAAAATSRQPQPRRLPTQTSAPAMRAAAHASDERERAQWAAEDAYADFLARNGGEDAIGITLSIED